jgi:hypothetical protein
MKKLLPLLLFNNLSLAEVWRRKDLKAVKRCPVRDRILVERKNIHYKTPSRMGRNVDKYDNIMIAGWLNFNHIPSLTGRAAEGDSFFYQYIVPDGTANTSYE